jgi:hypothetical protein
VGTIVEKKIKPSNYAQTSNNEFGRELMVIHENKITSPIRKVQLGILSLIQWTAFLVGLLLFIHDGLHQSGIYIVGGGKDCLLPEIVREPINFFLLGTMFFLIRIEYIHRFPEPVEQDLQNENKSIRNLIHRFRTRLIVILLIIYLIGMVFVWLGDDRWLTINGLTVFALLAKKATPYL